jgi:hypothetical protein
MRMAAQPGNTTTSKIKPRITTKNCRNAAIVLGTRRAPGVFGRGVVVLHEYGLASPRVILRRLWMGRSSLLPQSTARVEING